MQPFMLSGLDDIVHPWSTPNTASELPAPLRRRNAQNTAAITVLSSLTPVAWLGCLLVDLDAVGGGAHTHRLELQ